MSRNGNNTPGATPGEIGWSSQAFGASEPTFGRPGAIRSVHSAAADAIHKHLSSCGRWLRSGRAPGAGAQPRGFYRAPNWESPLGPRLQVARYHLPCSSL
jgi:hypothetical protein